MLYGRTTRGLKAGDVINWDEKSASGTLTLTIANQKAVIHRGQSPNSLTLDGKTVTQEELQKFLRLTPDAFTYAVLIPQFGEAFFDLSATDKLTLFSKIMELDAWLNRSKAAALMASELATAKIETEGKLGTCRALVNTTSVELTNLAEDFDNFAKAKKERLVKLRDDLAETKKQVDFLIKSKADSEVMLRRLDVQIAGAKAALQASVGALETLHGQREATLTAQATVQAAFRALRGQIKGLSGLTGTCPTCLQQISGAHLKAEVKKLTEQAVRCKNRSVMTWLMTWRALILK